MLSRAQKLCHIRCSYQPVLLKERPPSRCRVQYREGQSPFSEFSFRRVKERPGDSSFAMRRLHEEVEDVAATRIERMRGVWGPVDLHQSDAADGVAGFIGDEAEVASVCEPRRQPLAERFGKGIQDFFRLACVFEHLAAMTADEIE